MATQVQVMPAKDDAEVMIPARTHGGGPVPGVYPLENEFDPLGDGVKCKYIDTKEGSEAVLLIHGMG